MVNSRKFSISLPFCAGPSRPGLATVSVLLFEEEEYFHSTSHKPYSPKQMSGNYSLESDKSKLHVPLPKTTLRGSGASGRAAPLWWLNYGFGITIIGNAPALRLWHGSVAGVASGSVQCADGKCSMLSRQEISGYLFLESGVVKARCRAGGKPSTGFPPETRRAESTKKSHC